MAIAIGTLSSRLTSTGNPVTSSQAVAADEDLLVVMLVATGGTDRAGGNLTWGTQTLAQAGTTQKAVTSPEVSAELWYLLNPGAATETLTIPNTGAINIRYHVARAKMSARRATFVGQSGSNATSTNPTTTVPVGDAPVILFAVVGSGATTWAPSARTGTPISDTDAGANGDGFQYFEKATPGNQAMSWTFGTSDDWGLCAAAFGEVPHLILQSYLFVRVGDGMGCAEKIR